MMLEPDKKLERLNVQLDPDIRNRLNNLSIFTDWSVARIIRLCIDEGLGAVEQKALADPEIQARIADEQRRWSQAADMLALHQSKPPKTPEEVEERLAEGRKYFGEDEPPKKGK
jgi:predicted DNA-binding protein